MESHNPLKQEQCLSPFTHNRDPHTIPLLYEDFHSRHSLSSKICFWLHKVSSLLLIAEVPQGSFTNHLSERVIRYRIVGSAPPRTPGIRQISAWEGFQLGHALHFALISWLTKFSIWRRISKLSPHSQTASFLFTGCASKKKLLTEDLSFLPGIA